MPARRWSSPPSSRPSHRRARAPTAALANAQFASGDKQTAITTYRHAAALQPKAPQPLLYLARALIDTGDAAGGRTALQQAIALAPDYEPARLELIGLELKAGHRDAALKLAQDWRDAKPNESAPAALVGEVLMREERYPEAVKIYEALLKQSPSATAASLLASARCQQRHHQPGATADRLCRGASR